MSRYSRKTESQRKLDIRASVCALDSPCAGSHLGIYTRLTVGNVLMTWKTGTGLMILAALLLIDDTGRTAPDAMGHHGQDKGLGADHGG
jgi:hypothetical protein